MATKNVKRFTRYFEVKIQGRGIVNNKGKTIAEKELIGALKAVGQSIKGMSVVEVDSDGNKVRTIV